LHDRLQQLQLGEARVENQGRLGGRIELAQQCLAQRGFSGADFPGDFDEAFALANAVEHVRQGFAMALGEVEETRIRGDRKRFFAQPEELKVHDSLSYLV
jgi:hypothetical protein